MVMLLWFKRLRAFSWQRNVKGNKRAKRLRQHLGALALTFQRQHQHQNNHCMLKWPTVTMLYDVNVKFTMAKHYCHTKKSHRRWLYCRFNYTYKRQKWIRISSWIIKDPIANAKSYTSESFLFNHNLNANSVNWNDVTAGSNNNSSTDDREREKNRGF